MATTTVLTPEARAFLQHGTRTGKLATVRANGRPHVVPIWFEVDGNTIVFNTGEESIKAKNMRHDARVSFCVDDENPPFSFIQIDGTVEIIEDDPEALLHWATRLGGRYMGAERAEEFGKRNGVPGELLVRITPTKVTFIQDLAE